MSFPEAAAGIPTPGNSALLAAGPAYRAAVDAAAQHAAARAALDLVEAEVATTRRRLRAIRNHWVPRLQQALSSVRLALDEEELATEVRLRWAVSLRQGPGPAGTGHGG